MKTVVVVGAGISGLSTAYFLSRLDRRLRIVVLEQSDRLGGTIQTRHHDGFLMEGGPDSFLTSKPWALDLCRELGLEKDLLPLQNRRSYIFESGTFHLVPTRALPFLRSGLISWPGKIRAALETLVPRGFESRKESLGGFLRRRLGREAVDALIEPLLSGIFHSPVDRLCLQSTFPRFRELERRHRSLIWGMRPAPRSSPSPLLTLRPGMSALIDRLVNACPDVEFRKGVRVLRLEASGRIDTDRGTENADAVVLAVPAHQAAKMLSEANPSMAAALEKIPSASAATVSLGFRSPRLAAPENGTGFVMGRSERRRMTACTWSSRKFPGRAPERDLLVRCYMTDCRPSDEDLIAAARVELRDTMGLEDPPVVSAVYRWPRQLPVLAMGHRDRVREAELHRRSTPRLHVTGSGFPGTGIPDCIRQGKTTAETLAMR